MLLNLNFSINADKLESVCKKSYKGCQWGSWKTHCYHIFRQPHVTKDSTFDLMKKQNDLLNDMGNNKENKREIDI